MSRADEARRRARAEERDRIAHERPNVPSRPAGAADTWEGYCVGNRTGYHGWPTMKTPDRWRCGSCDQWLTAPVRTRTCPHTLGHRAIGGRLTGGQMCIKCGWVPA